VGGFAVNDLASVTREAAHSRIRLKAHLRPIFEKPDFGVYHHNRW
jgi:hypothetical protein